MNPQENIGVVVCPKCGLTNAYQEEDRKEYWWQCDDCGYQWDDEGWNNEEDDDEYDDDPLHYWGEGEDEDEDIIERG